MARERHRAAHGRRPMRDAHKGHDLPAAHEGEELIPHIKRKMGGKAHGAKPHMRLDRRARGGGTHAFRTPSGSVSVNARREAREHGDAMPGGRFPIRNEHDLENAKHAFGRAKDKPAVRRWINKKAHEMGEPPLGGDVGKKK